MTLYEVEVGDLQALQGLCHAPGHTFSTEVKQLRSIAPNLHTSEIPAQVWLLQGLEARSCAACRLAA